MAFWDVALVRRKHGSGVRSGGVRAIVTEGKVAFDTAFVRGQPRGTPGRTIIFGVDVKRMLHLRTKCVR